MNRLGARTVLATALTGALVCGVALGHEVLPRSTAAAAGHDSDSEFTFQVANYHTDNQGGQTLNMFFHYRYNHGLPVAQYPNYLGLRSAAIHYFDTVDITKNPFWEVLTKAVCTQLRDNFPIAAISCQVQIKGDDRPGASYEPGWHSAVYTIGEITASPVTGPT